MQHCKSPSSSSCGWSEARTKSRKFTCIPSRCRVCPRSPETRAYIDQYYTTFEQLRDDGLDALILTGANVSNPRLEMEPFWEPLTEVMEWAAEHVTSVLCSCLGDSFADEVSL